MEMIYKRLSKLLDIEAIQVYETNIRVFAKTKSREQCCYTCSSADIKPHGVINSRVVDVPYHEKKVLIYITKRRYKCASCSKTFIEKTPYVFSPNYMTIYLAHYILEKYGKIACYKLALMVQMDAKTIKNFVIKNKSSQAKRNISQNIAGLMT